MCSVFNFYSCHDLPERQNQDLQVGCYSYSLNDVLGCGNESVVYMGKHNQSNEKVAIKVIQLKRLKSTIQKILLRNEKSVTQVLIKQKIKGICQYKQIIESKTHLYIIMRFEQGGNLQQVLKNRKLDQITVKKYLFQIINSYIQLHQYNIVHRDLKPANILLDFNDDISIADFGYASIQKEQSKKYDYCLGSPVYCSPESLLSCQYGFKSDIWAIGVIAYKMLTFKTPWRGKNNQELVKNMQNTPIKDLLTTIQDRQLVNFIIGCCNNCSSQRFGINQLKQYSSILGQQSQKTEVNQKNEFQNQSIKNSPKAKVKIIKKQPSLKSEKKKKRARSFVSRDEHNQFNQGHNGFHLKNGFTSPCQQSLA